MAGFQGVSREGNITTLGRGGSDVTAAALAAALGAQQVEYFKDVPGVFSADPKENPLAVLLPRLSYKEAMPISMSGRILHSRCIEFSRKKWPSAACAHFSTFQ